MEDHEQASAAAEREADHLAERNDRLEDSIDAARKARDEAAGEDYVATPEPGHRGLDGTWVGGDLSEAGEHLEEGDTPGGPETDYPTKR